MHLWIYQKFIRKALFFRTQPFIFFPKDNSLESFWNSLKSIFLNCWFKVSKRRLWTIKLSKCFNLWEKRLWLTVKVLKAEHFDMVWFYWRLQNNLGKEWNFFFMIFTFSGQKSYIYQDFFESQPCESFSVKRFFK